MTNSEFRERVEKYAAWLNDGPTIQFGDTVFPWNVWYQNVVWPLSVCEAGLLLGDLAREIRKTGGGRQRSEGVKLIRRIRDRYTEQLAANGERVKADQIGWTI